MHIGGETQAYPSLLLPDWASQALPLSGGMPNQ